MSPLCTICCDEDEQVVFNCSMPNCTYQLCGSCVRDAFKDSSGSNSSFCPLCNNPTALEMISAVCGTGAIRAIEEKVRYSIQFELRTEMLKKDRSKQDLSEINSTARRIFNEITDKINLKCPRCNIVFHDYDGCNALTCSVKTCRAAFCAICLKDCGSDAHAHVRNNHGDYFNKKLFQESKILRSKKVIADAMTGIADKPFELRQLVQNHIDKAKLIDEKDGSVITGAKLNQFLTETRKSLLSTTKRDRLSLLSEPSTYQPQNELTQKDISPRCAIPNNFRVSMKHRYHKIYDLSIEQKIMDDRWSKISVKNVAKELANMPQVDMLINLVQSIKCAVVAFDERSSLYQTRQTSIPKDCRLSDDQISVSLSRVTYDGSIGDEYEHHYMGFDNLSIIGYNPNLRMIMLERHILGSPVSELIFDPLKHLIGDGKPSPVLTEILRPIPDSQRILNEQQQRVSHPLKLKTAMEVAGPPGTGKTKTIVELVRSLLECTDYDIIVLSERNGAINAIAEKFKDVCLKTLEDTKMEVSDPLIWLSLMTYGVGDAMGDSSKLFTLEEKLRLHPDIVDLKAKMTVLQNLSSTLAIAMRNTLAEEIENFGTFCKVDRATSRCNLINLDHDKSLSTPLLVIRYLEKTVSAIKSSLPNSCAKVEENDVDNLVIDHSELLGGLIDIRTDPEKKNNPKLWNRSETLRRLNYLYKRFEYVLQLNTFNEEKALILSNQLSKVKENYHTLKTRLYEELPVDARLHMSTIGSSHKLPVAKRANITERMNTLNLDESGEDSKKTVVIFDEAGCIPSYELLGLSRLGRDIEAIVLVGDKHQLPPYDASQGINHKRGYRNGIYRERRMRERDTMPVKSLLDVSSLTIDDDKVMLTSQYRVPRDIADILNETVYSGAYNTCDDANVPSLGLNIVNVCEDSNPRKKYVNSNEIEEGLRIADRLNLDPSIHGILIITPYKNQQREFQFQIKKRHMSYPVLTIDQCQGQEADVVILSLVRKPTKFLNKNRFNVALSRVRKKLYILVDRVSLVEACSNMDWDSSSLARRLLSSA